MEIIQKHVQDRDMIIRIKHFSPRNGFFYIVAGQHIPFCRVIYKGSFYTIASIDIRT